MCCVLQHQLQPGRPCLEPHRCTRLAGVSKIPGYNASISEVHHIHKKDAPSGTALTLAEHVKNGGWPGEVAIESERRGEVVGLHSLRWDSDHDVVALHHEAKSRVGFAEGAVWALKWTWKQHELKRFGLFTMNNLFDS